MCYESKKLNEHEQIYVTHDLDFEAIIHALKMWRHYILGKRFLLMIDQIGLRYLLNKDNWNTKKARWLSTLSEFHFKIKYIKGKENNVAYPLSKRLYMIHVI